MMPPLFYPQKSSRDRAPRELFIDYLFFLTGRFFQRRSLPRKRYQAAEKAADAIECCISQGIDKAMSLYNAK